MSHEEKVGWSASAGEARPNSRNHQMEALTQPNIYMFPLQENKREKKGWEANQN